MRLIYCHIENFGRLRNLDYTFEEGLNVICRENGWGKSTFSAFLRAMFYGFSGTRRKKKEENEDDRFHIERDRRIFNDLQHDSACHHIK